MGSISAWDCAAFRSAAEARNVRRVTPVNGILSPILFGIIIARTPLAGHFNIPSESRTIRGARINAFRSARNVVVFFESLVNFIGAAGRRHECLDPGAVHGGVCEVNAIERAAYMRNDRDVISRSEGGNAPQLGHPSAPMHVGLPNSRAVVLEKLTEGEPGILVFARYNTCRFDGCANAAEPCIIPGLKALFHPINAIRFDQTGHVDRVLLVPSHVAIEHDVTIGPE